MIELSQVVAREAPIALAPLTLRLGAGTHAFVGARDDGVGLALGVLAGTVRRRAGTIAVLGGDPRSPAVRAAVGLVPLEATLPEVLRVDEALALGAAIRGEPAVDPSARLAALGVADLARTKVARLSPAQVRAVAMVEALTSSRTRVVLLEEPLVRIDARVAAALPAVLRDRARAGACVVIATSSPRDARDLATTQIVFERGAVVRQLSAFDPLAIVGAGGVRMRVLAADNRVLAAALARAEEVTAIEADDHGIVLHGASAAALGRAVARAVDAARVDVEMMRIEPLALDEVRAAIAGDAAGAYRVAFERSQAAARGGAPGSTAPPMGQVPPVPPIPPVGPLPAPGGVGTPGTPSGAPPSFGPPGPPVGGPRS